MYARVEPIVVTFLTKEQAPGELSTREVDSRPGHAADIGRRG